MESERILAEFAQIEEPEKERISAARQERLDAYIAFFDNPEREQQTLEELYAPVGARLRSESASAQEQDLVFSIRWEADLAKWIEWRGISFDQSKAISHTKER